MTSMFRAAIAVAAIAVPLALAAQEPAANEQKLPAAAQDEPLTPVRVQLVLSRFEGEKRISSMPYTLQMIANDRATTRLRMGVEVPIANPGGGFNYRPVGTNIDCRAESAPGGGYRLHVMVNDSSIRLPGDAKPEEALGTSASRAPAFRSFNADFTILLRDGLTTQYTTATDPLSGEVLRVDATLTIVK